MLFLTEYVPQFEFTVSMKQQVIVTNAVSDKCDWITDTQHQSTYAVLIGILVIAVG